ncbi:hypothetical protein [Candidatus Palauibacter sp.]|uniref:hypothetical protein n=1 Tax=Candidatus Palauibacter sp. TaxID=3101350 RepID=UPI003B016DC8
MRIEKEVHGYEGLVRIVVLLPDRLRGRGRLGILEIGEDYLLCSTRDDFGVEFIQVWPLDRSVTEG